MQILPAIDLRRGRCVRLRQGDPAAETVFSDDPVATARHWVQQGAERLHVVILDGALGDQAQEAPNLDQLRKICAAVTAPVQFGGGLRTVADIEHVLALGVERVVLGTVAVQEPALVGEALARFGVERIVAGLDARQGWVATHGWQETSHEYVLDLARRLFGLGVQRAIYTDISRDGTLAGVDADGAAGLARQSGLKVIASGGVRDLEDIRRLQTLSLDGIEGVIVGQALYTGGLDLRQAIAVGRSAPE